MSTKPKLIVIGPLPPPVGGVETVTQAVLASKELGEFDIRHCDLTKKREKEKAGKLDLGNIRWALIHFWRLLRLLASFRPQVVYMPLTATWVGFWRDCVLAILSRLWGCRVVGHVHGGLFHLVLQARGGIGRIVQLGLRQFDTLLVLGTYWQSLVQRYPYRGTILIVPPTLRQQMIDEARKFVRSYNGNGSSVLGLYVGHVGVEKGVLDLLDALHALRARGKPARITFVGPPQEEGDWETVMKRRESLNLTDLTEFVGTLQGRELVAQFCAADYLVLPSYIEGLPVVFLEAGVFGLPIIGTPVGAVADLIAHEKNGLLVGPGNVDEIAASIERLMHNPEERERFGRALQQTVMDYYPDVVTRRIAQSIRMTFSPRGPAH